MISVIIPVYNAEKYLKRCVESVVAQGDSVGEIILVDDGSLERSGRCCDLLKNEYPITLGSGGGYSALFKGTPSTLDERAWLCYYIWNKL